MNFAKSLKATILESIFERKFLERKIVSNILGNCDCGHLREAYLRSCQICMMEHFSEKTALLAAN